MGNIFYEKVLYKEIVPTPGMGATELMLSDRHAFTIVRVSDSGKTFWMTRDQALMKEGNTIFTAQAFNYKTIKGGYEVRVHKTKDGRWKSSGGQYVHVGFRDEYYDPHF